MGSLAVSLYPSPERSQDAVRSALLAAPDRGTEVEARSAGAAVLGVANDPLGLRDSWLAADNGLVVAFSGRLDNQAELGAQLERAGASPRGDDPASVVLAAFGAWGDDTPKRLRGAYAAAVHERGVLRCFRDQLGFRTLFFRHDDEGFLAASEAKQVVAGTGLEREPDLEAVEDLFFHRLPERRTALRGVERFPKACISDVRAGEQPTFRLYWDPRGVLESAPLTFDEATERLAEVLETVVRRSITGNDVVSLSGGLDSPTVAAFGAPRHVELGGRQLTALAAVYPEHPSVDEQRYIELVAAKLGLDLHTFVQQSRPLDRLDHWVSVVDGPWDSLPLPEAAESYLLAARLGSRNVLTGELVEYLCTLQDHLIGHLVFHGRLRAAARWAGERRARGARWRRIAREAAPSLTPSVLANLYVRLRRSSFREKDTRLLAPWIDPAQFGGLGHRPGLGVPARRRWLETQLAPLYPAAWTSFEADDLCAARCGVQVRRPLADVDLWEFFLSLPAEVKFPELRHKALLRRAVRGRVPDEIVDRRDKTLFDEYALATADYDGLRRWLAAPVHRLRGIDYTLLNERIERRELTLSELIWAYNLATTHAFLSQWE